MIIDTAIFDFSGEKNLGKSYNQTMSLVGDNDHVCLRDGDTCWLTSDYGVHLAEYVRLYPNAVLTCWTNRINEKAEQQSPLKTFSPPFGSSTVIEMKLRDNTNIIDQLQAAEHQKKDLYKVTPLHGFVSGFCMVVPKAVWNRHKFPEKQMFEDRGPHNLLGVDNFWTNQVRAAGVPVLRMDGIMLFHIYRMLTNSKEHLL